jgi:RNA polymerase sigma-70 factor (ECF subfamily)
MTQTTTAFEQLARRHRGEIGAYLRRLLGNETDAEDVAQDTWLRAHRAFGRLPADANARAWLYRIATNRALTALRQRRDMRARSAAVDLETLPARGVDLDGRSELRRVARAVAALPPKQRAALVARRFSGLAYEDIAVTLGCSPEAARANVYQAIRRLRGVLEQTQ